MKNTTTRIGTRTFLHAIANSVLSAFALMIFVVVPVYAVQVWNIGDSIEQPPGTPKGKPNLIVSGVQSYCYLRGCRYIDLKVVTAGSGVPIAGAMAYLVRKPDVTETVVYNTDYQGCARIGEIEDCYRKLVVTCYGITVKQWVVLPPACTKNILVRLNCEGCITAPLPHVKCTKWIVIANRQNDDSFDKYYEGEQAGNMLRVWVPPGRYQMEAHAVDKQGYLIHRYLWNEKIEIVIGSRKLLKGTPRISPMH